MPSGGGIVRRVQIEYRQTDSLHPYPGNPRKNRKAVAGVAESIRRYGFNNPIVLDDADVIICGHTRLLAAQKLGMAEVPCVRASGLTDEEIRAYRLADNKVSELAEWDEDKLNAELSGLSGDMVVFGFAQPHKEGVYQDEPAGAWKGRKPKEGEVWLLGRHRLYVGQPSDAALDRLLDGQKADLLLSAIPSGASALAPQLFAIAHVLKGGASFYLWHEEKDGLAARGACRETELQVRQCLVWDQEEGGGVLLPQQEDGYQTTHMPCLYGWMDGSPHLWTGGRKQTTVLTAQAPADGSMPVPLMACCMENNTKGMDVVLDPWSRYGTAIIAAEQTGRVAHAVCQEQDAPYILARYAAFMGGAETVRCADE